MEKEQADVVGVAAMHCSVIAIAVMDEMRMMERVMRSMQGWVK